MDYSAKKIAKIGGGAAGMMAAVAAAGQGHKVYLIEKTINIIMT